MLTELTDLPGGLTARPLVDGDLDAVVALMRRAETEIYGEPFVDRADVASEWESPDTDPAKHLHGVFAGESLAACASAARDTAMVFVDPSHTGRGIGSAITAWTERAMAAAGREVVRQFVPEPDGAAALLMEERGYRVAWTGWVLGMNGGDAIAHRSLPDGFEVRPFEPADAADAHAVIEDAFAEWITRERSTLEAWSVENLQREGSDPGHHVVATHDGEIVGVSVVHDSGNASWVHQLAVRRDRRGLGLAQELLAASFEAARGRGRPRSMLGTDSRTGALGLYERLGMRPLATFRVWEKPLSPSARDVTS